MKIIKDPIFDALIERKLLAGLKIHIGKICSKRFSATNKKHVNIMVTGLIAGCEMAVDSNYDILLYQSIKDMFCFSLRDFTMEDWIQKINKLSISTPRKMVVKMLAERMYVLSAYHTTIQTAVTNGQAGQTLSHKKKYCVDNFPDLVSRQAVADYLVNSPFAKAGAALTVFQKRKWDVCFENVMKILYREDVDDAIISDAFNQVIAKIIHLA